LSFGALPLDVVSRTFNDVPCPLRRTDWEKDLAMKRGETLAAEVNVNGAKVARWQVIAEACMLGHAVRRQAESRAAHLLLAVDKQSPTQLARITALTPKKTFGVLFLVFSKMIPVGTGRYAYVRDSKTKVKKS
jgi:hypothetical protein